MESKQNNIINYIFIALTLAFVIHCLFKKTRNENMSNITENIHTEQNNSVKFNTPKIKNRCPSFKFKDYDTPKIYKQQKRPKCPVSKTDDEFTEYLTQFLLGQRPECDVPAKPTKKFNDDFFRFRDLTHNNSSQRYDSVDKIQQMYLQGNLDETKRYPNMKIKDIFDDTTKGPAKYTRPCVRLPQFDNVNNDGYYMSFGAHPMHLTRDNWTYPDEKTMNGAKMSNGLYGNDLSIGNNMPYKQA